MDHLWVEQRGSLSVVHFGVEYGSCSWDRLEETTEFLLRLADEVTPPCLLLDFTNTDYFGSEFISILLRCYKRIHRRRGRFSLCCPQSDLMRELEATRLNELWPIYDTRSQAWKSRGMSNMNTMRVLIADRDENLLETYGRFLTSLDVETLLVTNGVDCIAHLRDSSPDVLVIEPGLLWGGGDGVLEWMSAGRDLPDVPVILLVGRGELDQLRRTLEFPVDEFMAKPVSPRNLLKKIRWVQYSHGPNALFKLTWPEGITRYEEDGHAVGTLTRRPLRFA